MVLTRVERHPLRGSDWTRLLHLHLNELRLVHVLPVGVVLVAVGQQRQGTLPVFAVPPVPRFAEIQQVQRRRENCEADGSRLDFQFFGSISLTLVRASEFSCQVDTRCRRAK